MLQLDPGGAWPSVTLFGQAWQVSSVATWGLPALLFGAAALLAWRCRLRLAACESVDTAPAALAPQVRDSKEAV
jgi:branched-chain amino acid transport system permease protein